MADEFFAAGWRGASYGSRPRSASRPSPRASALLGEMREAGARRSTHLVAIGGGIVQDLATFAAQMFMRGIDWTYVPTTLLGMADSCIGGKSSLNVGRFKNLAGSYFPPRKVVVDPRFIATLPDEDVAGGLAEAAKITFCRGPREFATHRALYDQFPHTARELLHHTLAAKQWFIEVDEFDRAQRRQLNFGHTFGHALEAGTAFAISHGTAVALGVRCAIALGERAAPELDRALRAAARAGTGSAKAPRYPGSPGLRARLHGRQEAHTGLLPRDPARGRRGRAGSGPDGVRGDPGTGVARSVGDRGSEMKYSELMVDWLVELGYTHCFFVAGGNIMHLLDGVRTRMTCVATVHEVAAGIAAEYFNESRGRGSGVRARHGRARV